LLVNREDRTVEIEHGIKNRTLGIGEIFYSEMIKNLHIAKESAIKAFVSNKSAENRQVNEPENTTIPSLSGKEKNELLLEKQKNEYLLRNILPNEVAEEFIETGRTKAKKFDLVTIMFCNILDTNKHSKNLLPEDMISDIDMCFRHFDEIMEKHHLEKIKTIGYTYICAGGLPQSDEDNPLRAVQAGIEMQQFLKEFKETRQQQHLPWFEARIGIHSGPVIAGVVGHMKFTYDIWGDTVIVASQVEQLGCIGYVSISEHTYQQVKKYFAYRYHGTVETGEKTELDVYLVEK
jgi:class 3 adenylate cyclase